MSELTFILRIETLTPMLIGGERAAGNHVRTQDFVPGTQLRGALAGRIQRAGASENVMTELFGRNGIRVTNAYPGMDYLPLPLSSRRSKHDSPDVEYVDLLLGDAETHPADSASLERLGLTFGGVMDDIGVLSSSYRTTRPQHVISTHVEIDRDSGTHRDGVLFSLEALAERTIMTGRIDCSVAQAERLHEPIRLEKDDEMKIELSLGQARTRGFGRARVTISPANSQPFASSVTERLALLEKSAWWQSGTAHGSNGYFTLTLASDAIVLDERLRYRAGLDVADLVRERPEFAAATGLSLLRAATATQAAASWHGRAQLPRPDDIAIRMGSAFLYGYDATERDKVVQFLENLESDGIGVRRSEGFGRVVACMPWHWRGAEPLLKPAAREAQP